MKPDAILSLAIALIILILITLCVTKISNVERQLSELKSERQYSCNILVQEEGADITIKVKAANETSVGIRHNQLEPNIQTDLSIESANITPLKVCLSRWVQEAMTLEEAVHCMNG